MEFMGRLAALVPKPRVNLTRFHGKVKVIACIEEVTDQILNHLRLDEASQARNGAPTSGLYHPARYWMSATFY